MSKNKQIPKKDLIMYVLVPYNLSPIQQGIQAAHSIVEYSLNPNVSGSYIEWAAQHKTIIILNSGTTGESSTMEAHRKALDKLGVTYRTFREPDLNNAMTGIAFIVDRKEDTHITGYLRQMRLA